MVSISSTSTSWIWFDNFSWSCCVDFCTYRTSHIYTVSVVNTLSANCSWSWVSEESVVCFSVSNSSSCSFWNWDFCSFSVRDNTFSVYSFSYISISYKWNFIWWVCAFCFFSWRFFGNCFANCFFFFYFCDFSSRNDNFCSYF